MIQARRLFVVIAIASLITTFLDFVLALVLSSILERAGVPRGVQAAGVVVTVLLPIGISGWWIVRRLRALCTRSEAFAVAIAFMIFAPAALVIGTLFAPIPGGYAAFLGRPFGLLGAFTSIVLVIAFVSFVPSIVALRIAQRRASE